MTSNYEQFYGEWDLLKIHTNPRHPFDKDTSGFAFCIWRQRTFKTVLIYENPEDGYRSSAEDPIIWPETFNGGTVVKVPVTISALTSEYTNDGIEFRDRRNNKVILRLGTENTDHYYPWFCAEWIPENIEQSDE